VSSGATLLVDALMHRPTTALTGISVPPRRAAQQRVGRTLADGAAELCEPCRDARCRGNHLLAYADRFGTHVIGSLSSRQPTGLMYARRQTRISDRQPPDQVC
jgi:hypothetical protein